MSTRFVGEIALFGGPYAPQGWAMCDGQTLEVSQYRELFGVIGTTYGGDGTSTFKLPDLRGRTPIRADADESDYKLGTSGGQEKVTLSVDQMPKHNHYLLTAGATATERNPDGKLLATVSSGKFIYGLAADLQAISPSAISDRGGSQEHENMQPYLVVNFIIALQGLVPELD
ncbi:MAG: tail fiber protein [Pseudomonadota bacterium]